MICLDLFFLLVMFTTIWKYSDGIILFFGLLLCFMQVCAYTITATINPGIPKKVYETIAADPNHKGNYRRCSECGLWCDCSKNCYHCSTCVRKY